MSRKIASKSTNLKREIKWAKRKIVLLNHEIQLVSKKGDVLFRKITKLIDAAKDRAELKSNPKYQALHDQDDLLIKEGCLLDTQRRNQRELITILADHVKIVEAQIAAKKKGI